jgi:hypothetical protein
MPKLSRSTRGALWPANKIWSTVTEMEPGRSDSISPTAHQNVFHPHRLYGSHLYRAGSGAVRRATRVPHEGVSNGQWRSLLTTAGRRPRPVAGHHCRFPSSRPNTSASGGPRLRDGPGLGPKVVGHQLRGYPATVGTRRRSRPGPGVHVVQPPGAPHGPLARSEQSSPTRRDTRFRLSYPAAVGTPRAPGNLDSCPLRARSHGDSRGITGPGGQKLTDRAWEPFPAHTAWQSAPLHVSTPVPLTEPEPI